MKKKTKKIKDSVTHWNYRIIRHKHETGNWLGIHEVFYTNGEPDSCTLDPIDITSKDIKGIKWVLTNMAKAVKRPILDYEFFTSKERK